MKFGKPMQNLQHLQNAELSQNLNADFSNQFFAKILSLQRCKSMQILYSLEDAVKRIFSCKIPFWYSRERARQKILFPILLTLTRGPDGGGASSAGPGGAGRSNSRARRAAARRMWNRPSPSGMCVTRDLKFDGVCMEIRSRPASQSLDFLEDKRWNIHDF